ncbi:MAG: ABC transporter permease [Chloroflexi bacterium]|nr:ABC transporter permease [Chloroflexota bacterium]
MAFSSLILSAVIRFLARRLAFILLTLAMIVYLTNFGLVAARGAQRHATVPEMAGDAFANSTKYVSDLLNDKLGDTTVASVLGNRGTPRPIGELALEAYPKSMGLLLVAVAVGSLIGVALGGVSALKRHSKLAGVTWGLSLAGISTPSFFLAVFLQLAAVAFYQRTDIQIAPVFGFGWDNHLLLPALVLAARPLAYVSRITFSALSNVLEQDFIRTAKAKGLRWSAVLGDHAFRNAAISILTAVAVSLRFSLSTLPVVEAYFGWQGGAAVLLLNALFRGDAYAATTLLLMLGATFMVINLLLDALYRLIDPRLRT